jgi:hypothetical protein
MKGVADEVDWSESRRSFSMMLTSEILRFAQDDSVWEFIVKTLLRSFL